MAANKMHSCEEMAAGCLLWRNSNAALCGLDAADEGFEPRMANSRRPHWSKTGYYSLPMTEPDA